MIKKSTKKQNKLIENEKEPELINKISPRRKEQFDHSKERSSQQSNKESAENTGSSTQGKVGNSSQGKNNLEEVVKILQKPINFQIIFSNSTSNNKQISNQNKGQQAKPVSQQQNLLNGNSYKSPLFSSSGNSQITATNSSNYAGSNQQVIAEQDIPKYIEQCIESGLKHLESNQLKEAIQQFRNAEVIIDTYMQSEGKVSTDLMLAVVINLGVCFYKAGLFDEAYSCFENSDMRMKKKIQEKASNASTVDAEKQSSKTSKSNENKFSASAGKHNTTNSNNNQIFNDSNGSIGNNTVGGCITDTTFISSFSKTLKEQIQNKNNGLASCGIQDALTYFNNLGNKLKRKRLRLSLNLQMCILFSEIGKHEDALDYAKKSSKISIHILYDCLCICYFILIRSNLPSLNPPTILQTEPSTCTNNLNNFLTEPSDDSALTLSEKVLIIFEKQNQRQQLNNQINQGSALSQQVSIQQQNNQNNSGTLNSSNRRIRSEYGSTNGTNKQTTNQQHPNRSLSSSCDANNSQTSPSIKQRSGSTKGRLVNPSNLLEKKLSSSSAYSNSNSKNNLNLNPSDSSQQNSSYYNNLFFENISDSTKFSQEDIDIAAQCLPVFHNITHNFESLRDNFNEKLEKKVKLVSYLRQVYEELNSIKEIDPRKRLNFILSPSQLDMYFINGKIKDSHWLLTSNILNLLQMKPVSLATISQNSPIEKEIQIESTLKKIVESAICFYCISTETRFIEESSFLQNPNLSYKISDSEFWLGKSLEIAYALIPQDAPMISQIINVYTRFHGVDKQIIPEEEEFPDHVKLLKPQKGVNNTSSSILALKNNFFIPAIRTVLAKNNTLNHCLDNNEQQILSNMYLSNTIKTQKEQADQEEMLDKKQKNIQKELPSQNSKSIQVTKNGQDKHKQINQNNTIQNQAQKIQQNPLSVSTISSMIQTNTIQNTEKTLQNNIQAIQQNLTVIQSNNEQIQQNPISIQCNQEIDQSNSTSIQFNQEMNSYEGDDSLQEGSIILTGTKQGNNQSQIQQNHSTKVQQQSNMNDEQQSNLQNQINTDIQQNQQCQYNQFNQQQLSQIDYLQSNMNDNKEFSQNEGSTYISEQSQKQQQIQLKQEEQYLNQQKYQQGQFLGEVKERSFSGDKYSYTTANNIQLKQVNQQSQQQQSNVYVKDQQQIMEKIEQIVKKQRPQSSSVHSSSNSQNQSNNNSLNQAEILGTSTNIKKFSYSQHQTINQQCNKSIQYNTIVPESSSQICYSEPSNSNSSGAVNNNRIKISSGMNSNYQSNNNNCEQIKIQGRNTHIPHQQQLIQNQQQQLILNNNNNNIQQIFSLQQQFIAQAKIKKNGPQQVTNQVQQNLQNNPIQVSNVNQQKQQGHNFLKSFNQFLQQNRLQDDKKQIELKKPSAGSTQNNISQGQPFSIINSQQNVTQNVPQNVQNIQTNSQNIQQNYNTLQTIQSNLVQNIQQNPVQYILSNNQQQSTAVSSNNFGSVNGPITSEMLAAKKMTKQNFFENHRQSLPEQFGLSQLSSQGQTSQSTKNNPKTNFISINQTKNQKSFNYNILKQQQQQQFTQNSYQNQQPFNQNKNTNYHLNNENLMPTRHQSEPHNALKINSINESAQFLANKTINSDANYNSSAIQNPNIRLNSRERESVSREKDSAGKIREKKLSSFKQGDIQINTNFIYLPNHMSGTSSTTAHTCTNASFTEPSQNNIHPQENFLKQLELNNYSLKHQQKRNLSASGANKNSSSNNNQSFQLQQQNNTKDVQPMMNNFLQTSNQVNTQPTSQLQYLQQSNSSSVSQNLQQIQVQNYSNQNKQNQYFLQQQNIQVSSAGPNNILLQQIAQLDSKSQKVNSRQLHKRKMVSNNIQFNEKFNINSTKQTNYPSLQSPSSNFQSVPSTCKSNYAKISIPGSTQVSTKIQFPLSNSHNAQTQQQDRRESAHRKRRIRTDSYDSGAFNSFEADKLRSSFDRPINTQGTRVNTQN